jgi:hypothetical protein
VHTNLLSETVSIEIPVNLVTETSRLLYSIGEGCESKRLIVDKAHPVAQVNQPLGPVVAKVDARVAWLSRQSPNLVEARAAAERHSGNSPIAQLAGKRAGAAERDPAAVILCDGETFSSPSFCYDCGCMNASKFAPRALPGELWIRRIS